MPQHLIFHTLVILGIGGTSTDFDITTPGNYTFTYKAPNDAAGNLGPSIPRYVEVKNAPPIGITTFTISTTNTGYAKAGRYD